MNEKKNCIDIEVDHTSLNKCEEQIDRIVEKLKEADSLVDELASKTNGDRLAALEEPILDSAYGTVLNGIDISKLPIKSCISTIDDMGFHTITVTLQWDVRH